MSPQDQPHHMLDYWVECRGVKDALESYYPSLCQEDQVIREALQVLNTAEYTLKARAKELCANADDHEE